MDGAMSIFGKRSATLLGRQSTELQGFHSCVPSFTSTNERPQIKCQADLPSKPRLLFCQDRINRPATRNMETRLASVGHNVAVGFFETISQLRHQYTSNLPFGHSPRQPHGKWPASKTMSDSRKKNTECPLRKYEFSI